MTHVLHKYIDVENIQYCNAAEASFTAWLTCQHGTASSHLIVSFNESRTNLSFGYHSQKKCQLTSKDDHVGMREALYSWCLRKIVVGMSNTGALTVHLDSEKCHSSAVYFQISELSDRKVKL